MKTRILAMLVGVASLVGLSSCIESTQTLHLQKDGSGTIEEETIMTAQMLAMMGGFGGGAGGPGGAAPDPVAKMMGEGQYKEKAASYGEGVEFVKVEKVARNGGKGVKVTYKFKDINTVSFEPGKIDMPMGPGGGGGDEESDPLKFAYADGQLKITFPDVPADAKPEGEDAPEVPDANDPAAAQMMQMFNGMKISVKIVVEPGIVKTNASHQDGNTITLMEVDFGELMKNPEGLKVLQGLDMEDRKAMKKKLKDVKGVKIETKKTVKVTVK